MKASFLILLLMFSTSLWGQMLTTWGTEFWIPNNNGYIEIETSLASNVTIEDLANGSIITYSYASNSLNTINMNNTTLYNSIDPYFDYTTIEKSIKISSDNPINIRYSFESFTGGGSSMMLPKHVLGTNYTLSTHRMESFQHAPTSFMGIILVTATENNTSIELKLTHPTANGFPVNSPFTVTLNQGEILQIRGVFPTNAFVYENDFSGSTIRVKSSCSPISVHYYTGGYLFDTEVHLEGACCSDQMMEQYLPENFWGNEYYVVPEQHVPNGNLVKVYSRFDNNDVFIDGDPIKTLNANETFDTILFKPAYLKTSKQSFVSHYLLSAKINPTEIIETTDPEMIFVLPIQYRSSEGRFGFPDLLFESQSQALWLSIVTETANVQNIILDGAPLSASSFTPFSSISQFSWAYLSLTNLDHEIYTTSGSFQGLVFGNTIYGSRVSYIGIDTYQESSDSTYFAEIVCYEDEPITLKVPETSTNILWSTGETGNSIEVLTPGLYWVRATDSCGNSQFSQSYLITYNCDPQIAPIIIDEISCNINIPNVFSPNGDNLNDIYLFELPSCLNEIRFSIINRWGNPIYSTNKNVVNWDGYNNGVSASDGTYFWLLEAIDQQGIVINKSGFLSLLK